MTEFDEIRKQLDLLNDSELTSILRKRDYEQWRPEVFDIVASILKQRGISPSTHAEQEEDDVNESAGLDLVVVGSYLSDSDAEADRLALEEKGLRAWIFDEEPPPDAANVGKVQLGVLPEDLTAAMGALNSEPVPSSDLPADLAEPPCPKCCSRKIIEQAEIVESFDASLSSYRSTPQQMWFYKCAACGYKWSESYQDRAFSRKIRNADGE